MIYYNFLVFDVFLNFFYEYCFLESEAVGMLETELSKIIKIRIKKYKSVTFIW